MRSKRERNSITVNNRCLLVKHKPDHPFLSLHLPPFIFIFIFTTPHHTTHPLTSISIASHDPNLHFLTPGASSSSGHPFLKPCLILHPNPSTLAEPPSSSSHASSSLSPFSSSLSSDPFGTLPAPIAPPHRFESSGTTAPSSTTTLRRFITDTKLWPLWAFKPGSDPWAGANLSGTLGFLPIHMHFMGTAFLSLFISSSLQCLFFDKTSV